jgi:hypothetical protein
MMESDKNKTKDELIRELKALKSQFNERTACFEQECFALNKSALSEAGRKKRFAWPR